MRGAALLGASIVVGDGPGVRAVLDDVYAALEFAWDASTAGAVDEEVATTVEAVEAAVAAAYGESAAVRAGRRDARAGGEAGVRTLPVTPLTGKRQMIRARG